MYGFRKYGIYGGFLNLFAEFLLPTIFIISVSGFLPVKILAILVYIFIYDFLYLVNDKIDGQYIDRGNEYVFSKAVVFSFLASLLFFLDSKFIYLLLIIVLFAIHNFAPLKVRNSTFAVLSIAKFCLIPIFYSVESVSGLSYFIEYVMFFVPWIVIKNLDYILKFNGGFRSNVSAYLFFGCALMAYASASEHFALIGFLYSLFVITVGLMKAMSHDGERDIVVFQETMQRSHVLSLKDWAVREKYKLDILEFNILKSFGKAVLRSQTVMAFCLSVSNVFKVLDYCICLKKPSKYVIFIAPFDWKIVYFLIIKYVSKKQIVLVSSQVYWSKERATYRWRESVVRTWKKFDKCYFVGFSDAATLGAKSFGFTNVKTIHHSVAAVFAETAVVEANSSQRITVGYSGRLVPEKGVFNIVRLAQDIPNIEFKVVGSGILRSDLTKLNLKNFQLIDYVHDASELADIYSTWHVCIMPSYPVFNKNRYWEDVFGLCLAEAGCLGCIPVYSNLVGPISVFSKHMNSVGVVIQEPAQYESVKDALLEAIQKLNKVNKIEIAARFRLEFSANKNSRMWNSVFND